MATPTAPTPGATVGSTVDRVIPGVPRKRRTRRMAGGLKCNWQLHAMLVLPLTWLLVYQYIPLFGAQIAFRNYSPQGDFAGLYEAEWVGLENFRRFFEQPNFWTVLRNTLTLNLYALIAGFPLPIVLALALNYVGRQWFRRTVQLVSYAPHFISVVVIVGMLFLFVSPTRILVQALEVFGYEGGGLMERASYWKSLYVWSGVWQSLGFSTIIYLAALAGIDPTLHEAAILDGANKLQRIRDIDLPGILPVAMILLTRAAPEAELAVLNAGTSASERSWHGLPITPSRIAKRVLTSGHRCTYSEGAQGDGPPSDGGSGRSRKGSSPSHIRIFMTNAPNPPRFGAFVRPSASVPSLDPRLDAGLRGAVR